MLLTDPSDLSQETVISAKSPLEQNPPASDVPENISVAGPGQEKRLERLYADELKDWMAMPENLIPLPPHNRRKKNSM